MSDNSFVQRKYFSVPVIPLYIANYNRYLSCTNPSSDEKHRINPEEGGSTELQIRVGGHIVPSCENFKKCEFSAKYGGQYSADNILYNILGNIYLTIPVIPLVTTISISAAAKQKNAISLQNILSNKVC